MPVVYTIPNPRPIYYHQQPQLKKKLLSFGNAGFADKKYLYYPCYLLHHVIRVYVGYEMEKVNKMQIPDTESVKTNFQCS